MGWKEDAWIEYRDKGLYGAGVLEQSMEARKRVRIGFVYRPVSAEILKQSLGARNRVGIRLSYRPTRLHRLAKSITWNRFLGSLKG